MKTFDMEEEFAGLNFNDERTGGEWYAMTASNGHPRQTKRRFTPWQNATKTLALCSLL
jgi:hypothetical protein